MILFLGSGVSLPSGLPSVMQITDRLLKETYCRNKASTGTYYSAKNKGLKCVEPMIKVQQLLQLLSELDKYYLKSIAPYWSGNEFLNTGSIYRSVTSYEDIFYLTEQIRMAGLGLVDDARSEEHTSELQSH